jgi:hypothetical protein
MFDYIASQCKRPLVVTFVLKFNAHAVATTGALIGTLKSTELWEKCPRILAGLKRPLPKMWVTSLRQKEGHHFHH